MALWLLTAALLGAAPVAAQDAAAGRQKAQACAVCHGADGIALHPEAPNLAGQSAAYIELQLRHYRNGQRQLPVMNVVARPLTDDDIANLAAWFASIRAEAQAR